MPICIVASYLSLNAHIIFSTKHRAPFLGPTVLSEVHKYVGGTLRGLGAIPLRVGGTEDHVHILTGMKANHCVADLVREVKKASTNWMKAEKGFHEFRWQDGYAAFSVSPERVAGVKNYVIRQAEHHRTKSYIDELIELLTHAQIEFDPRYLE